MLRIAFTTFASPVRLTDLLLLWLQRARQRRSIDSLSDHVLKDVGLSRADVDGEVCKRFWQH